MIGDMQNKRGMGRVFLDKRTNIYISDFYVDGRRFTTSTGVREIDPERKTNEAQAWKIHTERWYKAHHGMLEDSKQQRVKVNELLDDLERNYIRKERKSLKTLRYELPRIRKFFGHIRASKINNAICGDYELERLAEGVSKSTVRRELAHVITAFNIGKKNKKIKEVPDIDLPSPNPPRETFGDWEYVKAMTVQLPEHLKRLPVVYFLTGWRKSEILTYLLRESVDFENRVLSISGKYTKNGKPKFYPYKEGSILEQALLEQTAYTERIERETGRVAEHFFHRRGLPIKSCEAAWNGAEKRARLEHRTRHDLRRGCKRAFEMSGASEHYSMKVMGHQSVQVTRNYAVADMEPLRQTTGIIDEYVRKKA